MKHASVSNAYSRELVLDVPQGTAVVLSKKVINNCSHSGLAHVSL